MASAPELRALYRRLLRELPSREPNLLANRSPIQQRIRSAFATGSTGPSNPSQSHTSLGSAPPSATSSSSSSSSQASDQHEIVDQLIQYLKAQRTHTTLLERYNPGMNMSDEDRVRLTARRVGMDIPEALRSTGGWKD